MWLRFSGVFMCWSVSYFGGEGYTEKLDNYGFVIFTGTVNQEVVPVLVSNLYARV